jgi:hypothetical protein
MSARLAELNGRTQPNLVKKGVHGEVVPDLDSKPSDVVAGPPISSAQQVKKAG